MEQLRPAVFPFYAAQLHHNLAASMTPERFRFPGQPSFQFQSTAAAIFPGMHPMAAHHHAHPAAVMSQQQQQQHQQQHQQQQQPHPHHHHQHPLVSQAHAAAVFQAVNGGRLPPGASPPTPQPAHTTPTSTSHHPHHPHHHHPHHPHVLQVPLLLHPHGLPHPAHQQAALSVSQDELDMALYGYTKGGGRDGLCHGHALSGLNLSLSVTQHPSATASSPSSSTSTTATPTHHHHPAPAAVAAAAGGGTHGDGRGTPSLSSSSSSSLSATTATTTPPTASGGTGLQNGGILTTPEPVAFGIDKILSAPQSSPGSASSVSAKTSLPKLDSASLELPEGLAIVQTTFAGCHHHGVFCTRTVISRSTRFGPFKGKVVHTSEVKTHDDNSNMWEIFQDGKLSHFIDGRGSAGHWMTHVKCARYAQEQNLIALQADGAIWYEVCKDIPQGTELLVWYGDCYLQFMGVPVALKEMADGGAQEEADTSEGFQCERCGKVFAYKYYRDKHLKYTRCVDQGDRKYPCTLCTRSFEKRDRLRIHILHVHEKHRPHKCLVCAKSFSQSSSLNKHMRVHSGERPYKCVYCNKAFTASSILRTHIRQHSGEKPFKCKHCGKAFASHAAHDSHVRRTHAKERTCVCNVCGKSFSMPFELKFHMTSHIKP